ncbi:pseudouridine synthase [Corynebacterium tapiri]|uniref:Pseudouridine synthase n=1 Tax=Corynebacterium tapiri TaxID=1448266 RepID=A0A5C4U569_9CORY|nr:pseudouridine synthase [Corynebacterium tapiri]TNL97653.1 rRNA pseudouridine synthase [Corynebacterium tapiri]
MTPPARRDGTPDPGYRHSHAKPAKKQHAAHPLADKWWEDDAPAAANSGQPQAREGERLQKVLARAGVASRRHAEVMIEAGRVEVNGDIVKTQGMRVDAERDVIRVDGVRVNANENNEYFILNKPRGVLSTMSDEEGRPCVGDLIADRLAAGNRLFHVGRLDADTEGLLLLTNDGELANRLTHPRYGVRKTYLATVLGEAPNSIVRDLKSGVELEDGVAKADHVQVVDRHNGYSLIRVELHEGRKHIVRRMLKAAGFPVQRLVRTKMHTVQLGEQKPGTMRALNDSELTSLYKAVKM